jgi:hypothetical protein
MAAPVVKWTELDGTTEVTKWQMGKVNAGHPSTEKTILIWNNFDGQNELSDMQDTQITTTDNVGDTLDVIMDKWVYVRCNSSDEAVFSQIGGDAMHTIQARNCLPGIVKGKINTGKLSDIENYASVTLYAHPPLNVPAGLRQFKTRVVYYYT